MLFISRHIIYSYIIILYLSSIKTNEMFYYFKLHSFSDFVYLNFLYQIIL